ncbi:MAG TPA: adenylyl-sulfate kinase, partial [Pseudonocardia sp.]
MSIEPDAGMTVLLTGLPSAGKTTLATATITRLRGLGVAAESLDGDEVRRMLWPELGMSRADRERNLARVTVVARMLARNGVTAVISAIAPFETARRTMREEHTGFGVPFVEVHVATPLTECRRRDVKGL